MKKIILLFLFFLLPAYGNASTGVTLHVSNTQPGLWEVFEVQLSLSMDSTASLPGISMPGIEMFDIFSQTQWESVRQVQDQFERTSKLILQLRPTTVGDFTIGPVVVVLDGQQYNSESFAVTVWGRESLIQTGTWVSEQTIHGLKPPHFQVPYFLLFCLALIAIFYFLIHNVISTKKTQVTSVKDSEKQENTYIPDLKKLSKQIEDISKDEFFQRLHSIIRRYIGNVYDVPFSEKYTFQEMKPYIAKDTELTTLFYNSYIHEFNEKNTTTTTKRKIIQDYIDILS